MTYKQLRSTLKTYANEDLGYARESGSMVVADTLRGNITINYEADAYIVFNSKGEQLSGHMTRKSMISWLIKQYDVSAVEIED